MCSVTCIQNMCIKPSAFKLCMYLSELQFDGMGAFEQYGGGPQMLGL